MLTKLGSLSTIQGINFSIIVATEFTLIFVRVGAFSRDKPVKKRLAVKVDFCYRLLGSKGRTVTGVWFIVTKDTKTCEAISEEFRFYRAPLDLYVLMLPKLYY